jgi:hypothetical protein
VGARLCEPIVRGRRGEKRLLRGEKSLSGGRSRAVRSPAGAGASAGVPREIHRLEEGQRRCHIAK